MTGLKRWLAIAICGLVVPVTADQVFNETVIVNGSIAVGFDAVNNEVFGNDRLRLKENNLRIGLDDVSSDPGAPSNDWEITANDTASGSISFLGILDKTSARYPLRVLAGAPQDAIRLRDTGRLGILTGAPQASLHFDVAEDPMSTTEAVVIGPDSITASGALLEVRGPLYISGAPNPVLTVDTTGGMKLFVEGSAIFSKNVEIASSRTFKEDIRDLTDVEIEEAFAKLHPVEYRYLQDTEKQLGFIAEDVPGLVATDGRRSLIPMDLITVLSGVVRDREERIEARNTELEDLRRLIGQLKQRRGESPQTAEPKADGPNTGATQP